MGKVFFNCSVWGILNKYYGKKLFCLAMFVRVAKWIR